MSVRSRYGKKTAKTVRPPRVAPAPKVKITPKPSALKALAKKYWDACKVDDPADNFASYEQACKFLVDAGHKHLARMKQDDDFIMGFVPKNGRK